MAHHREIVGDEEVGQPEIGLQILEHVDDLRLHRNVEGRDRLVANHQIGFKRNGAGNADALALSAREFMGEALRRVGRQADAIQQVRHFFAAFGWRADTCDVERLGNQIAHAHARVEAGIGILKDHLDAAAEAAELAIGHAADLGAIEHNAARGRLM